VLDPVSNPVGVYCWTIPRAHEGALRDQPPKVQNFNVRGGNILSFLAVWPKLKNSIPCKREHQNQGSEGWHSFPFLGLESSAAAKGCKRATEGLPKRSSDPKMEPKSTPEPPK
jgi:hypothetical protein